MRSEEQVRKRLQDLKYRYLQRLLRSRLRRRPHNCQFNKEHTFTKDGKEFTVRLCMLGVERQDWNVDICEDAKQAATCPAFLPVETRESVEAEFETSLRDPDTLKGKYRDLLALAWVLGDTESSKYTIFQRFWLTVTAWLAPRSKAITDTEDAHGDDQDGD